MRNGKIRVSSSLHFFLFVMYYRLIRAHVDNIVEHINNPTKPMADDKQSAQTVGFLFVNFLYNFLICELF